MKLMKKIIKEDALKGSTIPGSFLYEKNGNYYFNTSFYNLLFKLDPTIKATRGEKKLAIDFNGYMQKYMEICSKVENKPSFLLMNCSDDTINKSIKILNKTKKNNYRVVEIKSAKDYTSLNDEPCIAYVKRNYQKAILDLNEARNAAIQKNKVIVFFNAPESTNNPAELKLDLVLTLCAGRRISYVVNVADKAKFEEKIGKFNYEIIQGNCMNRFVLDGNGKALLK